MHLKKSSSKWHRFLGGFASCAILAEKGMLNLEFYDSVQTVSSSIQNYKKKNLIKWYSNYVFTFSIYLLIYTICTENVYIFLHTQYWLSWCVLLVHSWITLSGIWMLHTWSFATVNVLFRIFVSINQWISKQQCLWSMGHFIDMSHPGSDTVHPIEHQRFY